MQIRNPRYFRHKVGRTDQNAAVLQDTAFSSPLSTADDLVAADNYVSWVVSQEAQERFVSRSPHRSIRRLTAHLALNTKFAQCTDNSSMNSLICQYWFVAKRVFRRYGEGIGNFLIMKNRSSTCQSIDDRAGSESRRQFNRLLEVPQRNCWRFPSVYPHHTTARCFNDRFQHRLVDLHVVDARTRSQFGNDFSRQTS